MIAASSWDLGLEAGIWALRLVFKTGRGGTDGEGGKIIPICENIGHRPLRGRCPKNKAGYMATDVACGWRGAIFEVS